MVGLFDMLAKYAITPAPAHPQYIVIRQKVVVGTFSSLEEVESFMTTQNTLQQKDTDIPPLLTMYVYQLDHIAACMRIDPVEVTNSTCK